MNNSKNIEIYKNWESRVKSDLENFLNEIKRHPEALAMTKGFYVWDSPVIFQPKVMFMGINPGTGNPAMKTEIRVEPEERISYLDYHDPVNPENHYSYGLANTTFKIFESLGMSDSEIREFLKTTIKTNFFYLSTANVDGIANCLKKVNKAFFDSYMKWQYDVNIELYDIVRPNIIICEGKTAFNHVTESLDHLKNEFVFPMGKKQLFFKTSNMTVIGYERTISNITDSDLKSFVEIVKRLKIFD